MQFLFRKSISKALEIYEKYSFPLEKEYESMPYVKALSNEELPLRVLSIKNINHYDHMVIKSLVIMHNTVFIIPITDLVAIRGFELRAVFTKDFRLVGDGFPIFYGFNQFKNFKYGDLGFVTEGIKDAKALQRHYSYVIATLGIGVSHNAISFLRKITNKWVFISDNDYWGRKSKKRMERMGISTANVALGKDLGTVFEGNEEMDLYMKGLIRSYV